MMDLTNKFLIIPMAKARFIAIGYFLGLTAELPSDSCFSEASKATCASAIKSLAKLQM